MSFCRLYTAAVLFLVSGLASAQNTPFSGPPADTLPLYPQALANLQKGAGADTLGLSGSSVLIVLASGGQLSYPIPNCAVMFLTGSVDVNGDGNNDVVAVSPKG